MRQHEAKLNTPQLRKVYFCYYCAIVSACVLSNAGVLVENKLMSGSIGGARCYVRPPLRLAFLESVGGWVGNEQLVSVGIGYCGQ